jgi:hypothetical protein
VIIYGESICRDNVCLSQISGEGLVGSLLEIPLMEGNNIQIYKRNKVPAIMVVVAKRRLLDVCVANLW